MLKTEIMPVLFVLFLNFSLFMVVNCSNKSKYCTGNAITQQNPMCRKRAEERWFFNEDSSKCESFSFTGCFRGNDFYNSHATFEECEKICIKGEVPKEEVPKEEAPADQNSANSLPPGTTIILITMPAAYTYYSYKWM